MQIPNLALAPYRGKLLPEIKRRLATPMSHELIRIRLLKQDHPDIMRIAADVIREINEDMADAKTKLNESLKSIDGK